MMDGFFQKSLFEFGPKFKITPVPFKRSEDRLERSSVAPISVLPKFRKEVYIKKEKKRTEKKRERKKNKKKRKLGFPPPPARPPGLLNKLI